ncbi:MAG: hypothetical protein IPM50_11825 [Acidobacteriota bacterium]|nr:MAG: hypothetical protein IPM50_11825 [Acidobacteriota bacterium]
MATKYDTNPLDPEFPEKVKTAAAEGGPTKVFRDGYAGTSQVDMAAAVEAQPTLILEPQPQMQAPQQFRHYQQPQYQQPPQFQQNVAASPLAAAQSDLAAINQAISRKVEKLGLPENLLVAAPYIPWYIGLIAGVVILFITPKTETKVRFHAAQGLAAHVGVLIVTTILGILGNVTDIADLGNFIFVLVTSIMLTVFAVKAYRGRPVHIESVENMTNWLEDKISPSSLNNP